MMNYQQAPLEPLAITGFSFKMPQSAIDEAGLWKILVEGTNVMSEWPATRANIDSHHDGGSKKPNTLHGRGAHFMAEDPGAFDAPFFSITAREAASMDPQQRRALEVAYHTFENAGISLQDLRGSLTAVYCGSMGSDWSGMGSRDPDTSPRMYLTGSAVSLLPNKISWFFDLRGPSIYVDTACSAGMSALDLACQTIHSGNATAALVLGTSALLSPEISLHLANMNFLSPDSRSFSFDARANGYARGEGVAALYLKPLRRAVLDGDVVRAVVRATASNQDGRTPGLTQPSSDAQESLIRAAYAKAGLELDETRYVEAHGTGTQTGDPIEANTIGRVFGKWRSPSEPLFLGSIKANVGHLEGSSGPAGIIKAVMMLERGIIPPQALFKTLNPAIDAAGTNIKIPTTITPWPQSGLRRISVNSFGFGGANAHAILDDALHYMQNNNLQGYHRCVKYPASSEQAVISDLSGVEEPGVHSVGFAITNGHKASTHFPRLLIWSAADASAIDRMLQAYDQYYLMHIAGNHHKLDQLAYTLAARRSFMAWRSFAIVDDDDNPPDTENTEQDVANVVKSLSPSKPVRMSSDETGIAFVFTGQGAQYAGMGLTLLRYPVFEHSLRKSDDTFTNLGCNWSLFDVIRDEGKISRPEFSQPLCTALQIAQVDLLQSFNIHPVAAVGHSSGEIAAAYAVGALSHESACKIAYFRGKLAGQLRATTCTPGAMLSANLREGEIPKYLKSLGLSASKETAVHVACVNSPYNVTLAGPEQSIDIVKADLDKKGTFAQKLNTGIAYHSPVMQAIAQEYAASMGTLQKNYSRRRIPMVSSVTGDIVKPEFLTQPEYWVSNLVSPVQFRKAVDKMASLTKNANSGVAESSAEDSFELTDLIEIGPHSALRRSIKDTVPQLRYHAWVQRSTSALRSTLELVGTLYCLGYPASVTAVNRQDQHKHPYLVDCPSYPFDHSRRYWAESRVSRNWRLREYTPGFLLGRRSPHWNPLKPRWRNLLCVETIPWLGDHAVNGILMVPGTGSLVIAMEAVRQVVTERDGMVVGFRLKDARFIAPLRVGETMQDAVETEVHLDRIRRGGEKESTWYEVRIFIHWEDRVIETFNTKVELQFAEDPATPAGREMVLEHERIRKRFEEIRSSCTSQSIEARDFYKFCSEFGFKYGDSFEILDNIRYDARGPGSSTGEIPFASTGHQQQEDSPVHPAVLDAVFQVMIVQASKGIDPSMKNSTVIPQGVGNAWISSKVWSQTTKSVHISNIGLSEEGASRFSGHRASIYAVADDGSPLCAIENLSTAAISRETKAEDDLVKRKLLYGIAWKPRLGSLAPKELQDVCRMRSNFRVGSDLEVKAMADFFPKMGLALQLAVGEALREVPDSQITQAYPYYIKYVAMLRRQQTGKDSDLSGSALEALLQDCEAEYPQWSLFTTIARALPSILRGEIDPRELMSTARADEMFFADVYRSHMRDGRFLVFLELASHEDPGLRILEIGAGTGEFTQHILSTLEALEAESGGTAFADYVFTDTSTSRLDSARSRLKEHLDRLSFINWNPEHDPAKEDYGLELRGYDLIFAGNVLHATPDIAKALTHVRKLLRPGGYLVLQEFTSPQAACMNIGFGLLESWWNSTESWRRDGPLATQQQWDQLLWDNGFSGIQLALKDFDNDSYHLSTIMMTSAIPEPIEDKPVQNGLGPIFPNHQRLVILTSQDSVDQTSLAEELFQQHEVRQIVHFADIEDGWTAWPSDIVVSLIEVGGPRLASLDQQQFARLQQFIQGSKNLMWVTASNKCVANSESQEDLLPWDPRYDVATGFLRTIRSEESDKHIVTLTIHQSHSDQSRGIADYVTEILYSSFDSRNPHLSSELEYIVEDGNIMVGRMVYEKQLDEKRESYIHPQERIEPWLSGPPLAFAIGQTGMLDSLCFVEDEIYSKDLASDEVEIEAAVWPISLRDVLIILGKIDFGSGLGYECAGTVTRVGSACSEQFRPGDRVGMGVFGSMRSHPRGPAHCVRKIPDHLSFEDAVSPGNPCMTAWQSLVNIAKLKKGEKVLIHSAAGATGQMAVQIAQMIGATVFATVSSDEKRELLVREFNIPRKHIFHSRDVSFAQGIKRVTDGRGVDVILNSLAGDSLQASWECIAPYGRFIEIGKIDIMANSSLPMAMFAKNVTFAAVDLAEIAKTNIPLADELLTKAMELVADGSVRGPTPSHIYSVAEAEKAFRFMQSGKNTGRIMITRTKNDRVTKHLIHKSTWSFDPEASYIVVGGFGGLGRVTIEWMVLKGARNFLVPSRSGASSSAASELVAKLRNQGIHIDTPHCDVSSATELSEALQDYAASMPRAPIKGCINSAMDLQDAIFSNMTHEQWTRTIKSKVNSSWNLHTLLPPDMDFFIMLSSMVGVYGAMGQSNYAAGCSFQDALARARTDASAYPGVSVSLDLSWLVDAGIVSERADYRRKWEATQDIAGIHVADLLAVLDHYCDPATRSTSIGSKAGGATGASVYSSGQLLIGAVTPGDLVSSQRGEEIPSSMSRPLLKPFINKPGRDNTVVNGTSAATVAWGSRFRAAGSHGARQEIVIEALKDKLARALGVGLDDVDAAKPVTAYGVDSLMAVELRNWMRKDFGVEVHVFELLAIASISRLGEMVTNKAEDIRKEVEVQEDRREDEGRTNGFNGHET
ncbi:hypothetical protein F5Y06DRAFT_298710 [Hypoxylon sp. FL0890]|nr:hypothetical protein F5Y06DRAFT_298710 [Hypoxylon sp. FL0890]